MTDVVSFVRCSCGELISICNATCPQCGAPHTRVLTPASLPSAPVPPAVSGGNDGAIGSPLVLAWEVSGTDKRPDHGRLSDAPSHRRDNARGEDPGAVEIRRDLTTAERGYVMPVGIDRDADVFEDLRGIDPACRIFLEDEYHRCTRNTGQLVRLGESCFYSANRAVRKAS